MATQKVFVYGTLMHKENCAAWARDGEVAPPIDGTTNGILLDFGAYPYADFDGDGVIHGQVLTFDDESDAYALMCQVERGAGYVEREVIVTTSTDTIVCTGWQISERRAHGRRMPQIVSGDWAHHCATERERFLAGLYS